MNHDVPDVRKATRAIERGFLAAILGQTIVGAAIGLFVNSSFDEAIRWLVPAVLAFVAITHVLLMTAVILPKSIQNPASGPSQAASLGYAFADTPATFGVVAALVSGSPYPALAFGALALIAWETVRRMLADAYHETLSASS